MSFSFNAHQGLILVDAELAGPLGRGRLRLALDTGATRTLVSTTMLVAAGYDPARAAAQVRITTASGVEYVPYLPVLRLSALGQDRTNFPVVGHTLPPSTTINGLLGLDFLWGQVLTIDFRAGQITLT